MTTARCGCAVLLPLLRPRTQNETWARLSTVSTTRLPVLLSLEVRVRDYLRVAKSSRLLTRDYSELIVKSSFDSCTHVDRRREERVRVRAKGRGT